MSPDKPWHILAQALSDRTPFEFTFSSRQNALDFRDMFLALRLGMASDPFRKKDRIVVYLKLH